MARLAVGGAGARGLLGSGAPAGRAFGSGGFERGGGTVGGAALAGGRAGLARERLGRCGRALSFSAPAAARARLRDFAWPSPAAFRSFSALRLTAALACLGAGSLTPARRAFDRPMATACLVERTPCLPARTCSISSRMNSPACVDADLPWRLSRGAFQGFAFGHDSLRACVAKAASPDGFLLARRNRAPQSRLAGVSCVFEWIAGRKRRIRRRPTVRD